MSCSERFKGIALIFKGEVEPEGITRTFISYFFLCSSHDVWRDIQKAKQFFFPLQNWTPLGLDAVIEAKEEKNVRNTLAFQLFWQPEAWTSTTRERQFKYCAVTAVLHCHTSSLQATAWAAGDNHKQNLRLDLQRCSAVDDTGSWHCTLLIHSCWKKHKSHCCLGTQRYALALKDSPHHCWHCVWKY